MKKPQVVQNHPAETAGVGLYGTVLGVLTAFGVDPKNAAAIAGIVAAVAPTVITWWKAHRSRMT